MTGDDETLIDSLRAAVAKHKDWPTDQTANVVAHVATILIERIDARAAYLAFMRQMTPSQQAIAEILGWEGQA